MGGKCEWRCKESLPGLGWWRAPLKTSFIVRLRISWWWNCCIGIECIKAFWKAYLDVGAIDEAWLVLGPYANLCSISLWMVARVTVRLCVVQCKQSAFSFERWELETWSLQNGAIQASTGTGWNQSICAEIYYPATAERCCKLALPWGYKKSLQLWKGTWQRQPVTSLRAIQE